jgi:hypothetical protein
MARNLAQHANLIGLAVVTLAALGGITGQATATADPLPYGPDTCMQGFVWREAQPGDVVCVTPDVRSTTAQENAQASQNVDPNGGAYGPNTCKQGFVWRNAFSGDGVCVTPASETQAANDNAAAASRKAANLPQTPSPQQGPSPCVPDPLGLHFPGAC